MFNILNLTLALYNSNLVLWEQCLHLRADHHGPILLHLSHRINDFDDIGLWQLIFPIQYVLDDVLDDIESIVNETLKVDQVVQKNN